MFRKDMVTKFGEQVTQMMIEAKASDSERAEKEIRFHPDCPKDQEDPYSLQHMPCVPCVKKPCMVFIYNTTVSAAGVEAISMLV